MVLDILAGSVLLAFGILITYFSVEGDLKDSRFLIQFLIGIAAIIAGGWIIITRITLALLLTKFAGLLLVVVGFFLVVQFPDVREYQWPNMSKTGILIGLILLVFGVYLLFFA